MVVLHTQRGWPLFPGQFHFFFAMKNFTGLKQVLLVGDKFLGRGRRKEIEIRFADGVPGSFNNLNRVHGQCYREESGFACP